MGNHKLTKVEALKLIAPVVDDEVTEKQRTAFLQYISRHDDVRRKYESMQKMKNLVASRFPRAKAPDGLKKNILKIIANSTNREHINDHKNAGNSNPPISKAQQSHYWKYTAAAVFLMAFSMWGFMQFSSSSTQKEPTYNIEEYVVKHFERHHGSFVAPSISTASIGSAETELYNKYNLSMTVPRLKNADFKGVVYTDFVPGFKAPMLEYYLPSEDEYAYIFTFDMDQMKSFGNLYRNGKAVKRCNQPKDFHVCNINGKQVVSWKWDNNWYAAISSRDGKTLASLIKPLDYSLNNDK